MQKLISCGGFHYNSNDFIEENGELKLKNSGVPLPPVTAADNGKFLGVDDGAWSVVDAPSGAMYVEITYMWWDGSYSMDKTWQEINDARVNGTPIFYTSNSKILGQIGTINDTGTYSVLTVPFDLNARENYFACDTPSGYPVSSYYAENALNSAAAYYVVESLISDKYQLGRTWSEINATHGRGSYVNDIIYIGQLNGTKGIVTSITQGDVGQGTPYTVSYFDYATATIITMSADTADDYPSRSST